MTAIETTDIATVLRDFIRKKFDIPANDPEFNDNVDLFNYGYIDSFGAMELTMFIESDLKVHISAEDWVTFPLSTVHEISQFVARRRKGEV